MDDGWSAVSKVVCGTSTAAAARQRGPERQHVGFWFRKRGAICYLKHGWLSKQVELGHALGARRKQQDADARSGGGA